MKRILLTLFACFFVSYLSAAEWNQWRGPDHDGISKETGLLKSWPQDGPRLLWRQENIGLGYSNFSFSGGKIYSMGDFGDDCCLYALDEKTGKGIWRIKVGKAGASQGNGFPGSRCTPATDGKLVFALGQFGDFVCADAETGKEYWRCNVERDLGGHVMLNKGDTGIHWNFSMSPILDGDRIVMPIGGKAGTVVAWEKSKKGPKIIWRSRELTDAAPYTSVVPMDFGGVPQYLVFTDKRLAGLDAKTGKVLWQADRPGNVAVCSDPVYWMDGENTCYIIVSSAYGVGAHGFKVTTSDGKFSAERIYADSKLENHHGGIVQVDGHFYFLTQRECVCVDPKTGKTLWNHRSVGKGSVSAADGRLILRAEKGDGEIALVEPSPDGYKEISRFAQPDRTDKNSWVYPTVYGGRLYIRDQGLLLCYEVK